MKMYNDKNYFKTSDLALATTLSLRFPIDTIDRFNPRKVLFVFHRLPELEQLVEQFWQNKITVEPQTFTNQIKNLKTRIYSNE
jgi:hypothetical protein